MKVATPCVSCATRYVHLQMSSGLQRLLLGSSDGTTNLFFYFIMGSLAFILAHMEYPY